MKKSTFCILFVLFLSSFSATLQVALTKSMVKTLWDNWLGIDGIKPYV